jgi:hypothetical protein
VLVYCKVMEISFLKNALLFEKIMFTVAFQPVFKYFLSIRECSRGVVSPHSPYISFFKYLGHIP